MLPVLSPGQHATLGLVARQEQTSVVFHGNLHLTYSHYLLKYTVENITFIFGFSTLESLSKAENY